MAARVHAAGMDREEAEELRGRGAADLVLVLSGGGDNASVFALESTMD